MNTLRQVLAKKRQNLTILCRLQKPKRINLKRLIPHTDYKWVQWLSWRINGLPIHICEQQVLASGYRCQRKRQTAITSHHGLYRFTKMPFGLKNAPNTFQWAEDVTLTPVRRQTGLVHLHDIVTFSKPSEKYIDLAWTVLSLLQKTGVPLKIKKCWFFTNSVDQLGQVIRPRKLETASHTTDAIDEFNELRNEIELRSILGLCNVFRQFVPISGQIAAPPTHKLQMDQSERFGSLNNGERCAMRTLIKKLISFSVLTLPYAWGATR